MKLPKQIYVEVMKDGDTEWLNANEKPESMEDGKIGIYELKEVKTKRTETILK